MKKADLVREISDRTGILQVDVKDVIDVFRAVAIEQLSEGGRIYLHDFITIDSRERNPQNCRNPRTGEMMLTPATRTGRARLGKSLLRAAKEAEADR